MALEVYSGSALYINGALLVENTTINVDRRTGAQNQMTIQKGFAGQSPGAKMLEISFDNAVPTGDFEYDPGDDMSGLRVVSIALFAAGRTLTTKGFVDSDTFKHAVNGEALLSMKMTCEFAKWQ